MSLEDIARSVNPIIRGWINYYGAYQRSSLGPNMRHINRHLLKWVKRKYKKRGRYTKRAKAWLERVAYYRPELFAHWQFGVGFTAGSTWSAGMPDSPRIASFRAWVQIDASARSAERQADGSAARAVGGSFFNT